MRWVLVPAFSICGLNRTIWTGGCDPGLPVPHAAGDADPPRSHFGELVKGQRGVEADDSSGHELGCGTRQLDQTAEGTLLPPQAVAA